MSTPDFLNKKHAEIDQGLDFLNFYPAKTRKNLEKLGKNKKQLGKPKKSVRTPG